MPDQFSLLLEWRRNEGATRNLAKLPFDFYSTTAAYLADVRRSYETDLRENPSARKGEISRQTYQRASQAARDVIEGRTQKILTAAFQTSVGGLRELPNSLPEEREVYDRLLEILLAHRRRSSPYLEPAPTAGGAPSVSPGAPPNPAPAAREGEAPPGPVVKPSATAYVRVIKDGRPVEFGSETVDLRAEDVLSLPIDTAELLVKAKVAERLGPSSTRATVT